MNTVMRSVNWNLVFWMAFACLVLSPSLFASEPDELRDFAEILQKTYNERAELLDRSQGKVNVSFIRINPDALEARFSDTSPKDNEWDSIWSTVWYQSGDKRRYDTEQIFPSNDDPILNENPSRFVSPYFMRVATDLNQAVYFDVLNTQAYINNPPNRVNSPAAIRTNFDIDFAYNFLTGAEGDNYSSILNFVISDYLNQTTPPESYEIDLEQRIIGNKEQLVFTWNSYTKSTMRRNKQEFWFDPGCAYSLVKAIRYSNVFSDNRSDENSMQIVE